ncbi:DUF4365 domain-containing protein [Paraburkholderia sp. Ac-20340]|uniref:DUF4365 domain-containing protein n=1 Tax=Paraburkholderia sp. Ac-20340 TaxID=2703888 RepID=UPI001F11CF35|nr:DUF4365 domain-containing protein [Paraburkholderia sp. Ac-20340]
MNKTITDAQLLGAQGTGLIDVVVSRMGFVWRPTAVLDSGVDGEIEIRDPTTGHMSGVIIKAQSKALSALRNETDEGFDYWPDPRDVEYWLSHNVPVILIVSRPRTNDVYWLPVREQVAAAAGKKAFHFVKEQDRLDENARGRLMSLGQAGTVGAVLAPEPRVEALLSNLIPVTVLPDRLYLASTQHRKPADVVALLRENRLSLEFVLKNERILAVRDLSDQAYESICDRGTVEDFACREWAQSNDLDKRRDFVRLLNGCLRELLRTLPESIRYDKETSCYCFPPSANREAYEYTYRSAKNGATREVFKRLINKTEGHVMGYRHSAMKAQFLFLEGAWYLEVTPTYFFTKDGFEQSRLHGDWLKRLKEFENNQAVRGQLLMWADLLRTKESLFAQPYPYLGFGEPREFSMLVGIDDGAWTAPDIVRDKQTQAKTSEEQYMLL